jgi:hypothetical protein
MKADHADVVITAPVDRHVDGQGFSIHLAKFNTGSPNVLCKASDCRSCDLVGLAHIARLLAQSR